MKPRRLALKIPPGFSSQYVYENLVKKVLFKSIVYRLINKVETFMNFGSGMSMIPGENEFPQFLELKVGSVVSFLASMEASAEVACNESLSTISSRGPLSGREVEMPGCSGD